MKFKTSCVVLFLIIANAINATVTFQVNVGGFENVAGTATTGMSYGWVVDTGGDGFLPGSYLGFDISTNGQFLSTSLGATDDWFVYGSGGPPTTVDVFPQGAGTVSSDSIISFTNLDQGMEFAIIWFPTGSVASSGDPYGLARDVGSNMIVPTDTGTNVLPTGVTTTSVDFTIVPEPSTYAFALGFVMLGFVVFKRLKSR